ncbi:MAG: PAS domain-containing protein [Pseudomonadota bacterium]
MIIPAEIQQYIQSLNVPLSLADGSVEDMPLLQVNPSFESLTGYASENIVGKNCRFLQAELEQVDTRQIIRSALDASKPCQTVLKNKKKSGQIFDNLLFLFPLEFKDWSLMYLGSQFELQPEQSPEQALDRGKYLSDTLNRLHKESRILSKQHAEAVSDGLVASVRHLIMRS